jgi:hypothetical protein
MTYIRVNFFYDFVSCNKNQLEEAPQYFCYFRRKVNADFWKT